MTERVEVAVIGGGQAGLCTAAALRRRGVESAVLEASPRLGSSWRERWDSLVLYTPARYSALPGVPQPGDQAALLTKDAMADYLERYARECRLNVRTGCAVSELRRAGSGYTMDTARGALEADQVVVATGPGRSRVPAWAARLDAGVRQVTSLAYRNPDQLVGDVLVVGAGTSGVEIAIEAARAGHRTTLCGRDTGQIPARAFAFGGRPFWFFATRVASVDTPIGRRMQSAMTEHGAPLIRVAMSEALEAGVERAPRATGAESTGVVLEDGRRVRADTVVWCTGYQKDVSWIKIPGLVDEAGRIRHRAGAVEEVPGLYFVGLHFQTRLASGFVGGVHHDASRTAAAIAGRRTPAEVGQQRQVV